MVDFVTGMVTPFAPSSINGMKSLVWLTLVVVWTAKRVYRDEVELEINLAWTLLKVNFFSSSTKLIYIKYTYMNSNWNILQVWLNVGKKTVDKVNKF